MSNVIQIKSGSGKPSTGVLQKAELGYDLTNGYLYIGNSNGQTVGINVAYATSAGSATNATNATNAANLTSTLPIDKGGTNATTASAALSNLGGVPTSRTINGKALSSNISLSASDVGARASSWMPSAVDVGAVPTSRTINGKALSANISLVASDVGARASNWMPSATDIGGLTGSRALISDSNGKIAVSAVTSTELGYLDGVTSAIQTQLNSKMSTFSLLKENAMLSADYPSFTITNGVGYQMYVLIAYFNATPNDGRDHGYASVIIPSDLVKEGSSNAQNFTLSGYSHSKLFTVYKTENDIVFTNAGYQGGGIYQDSVRVYGLR